MYVKFMKNFHIANSNELLDSFRPAEPKNIRFQVSGHDVRRVHEKFASLRLEQANG